jgi:hypothetical protein
LAAKAIGSAPADPIQLVVAEPQRFLISKIGVALVLAFVAVSASGSVVTAASS